MSEQIFLYVMYGSQAHGLAGPDSDFDFAEFYVSPTIELLKVPVSSRPKTGHHTVGAEIDRRRTEVGAFLDGLIRSSHINDVEFLYAPIPNITYFPRGSHVIFWRGEQLREIGKGLLSAEGIASSSKGYLNSLLYGNHRFTEEKQKRNALRVAYAAKELLETGEYPILVPENGWGHVVRHSSGLTVEQVVEKVGIVIQQFDRLVETSPLNRPRQIHEANEWLMEVRKVHWDG